VTRVQEFIYSRGAYAYGGYPDIDELYQEQAVERDRAKREALLHRIQQLTMERVMFAPVMDLQLLTGVGPRMAEHAINVIPLYPFPAYEEIRLKGR
jgi:peptide/nickel transport system substrate-binding protein